MFNKWVWVLVGVLVLVGYFVYTQWRIESLSADNGKMEIAVEQQKQSIALLKGRITEINETNLEIRRQFNSIQEETSKVKKVVGRHDLDVLMREKPGLMERRINDGTREVFGRFEAITQ